MESRAPPVPLLCQLSQSYSDSRLTKARALVQSSSWTCHSELYYRPCLILHSNTMHQVASYEHHGCSKRHSQPTSIEGQILTEGKASIGDQTSTEAANVKILLTKRMMENTNRGCYPPTRRSSTQGSLDVAGVADDMCPH